MIRVLPLCSFESSLKLEVQLKPSFPLTLPSIFENKVQVCVGGKPKKKMIYVWFFQYTIYKGRGGGGGLGRCGCQICLEMQLQFSKLKYESSYLLDISKFINRIEWFVNLYHLKWGNIPTSTNLESAFANFFVTPCQDQNCKCNLNSSLTWKEE